MHIGLKGIELGELAEGKRNVPYDDGCGNMTIGIGHLIRKNESFPKPLTDQEIYDIYRTDCIDAENKVKDVVNVEINQNQFDVLVDMAFNMRTFSFINSSVVRLINQNEFDLAAKRLLLYTKAFDKEKQEYVELKGLVKRCKARYKLFTDKI
jgi:lysozyme